LCSDNSSRSVTIVDKASSVFPSTFYFGFANDFQCFVISSSRLLFCAASGSLDLLQIPNDFYSGFGGVVYVRYFPLFFGAALGFIAFVFERGNSFVFRVKFKDFGSHFGIPGEGPLHCSPDAVCLFKIPTDPYFGRDLSFQLFGSVQLLSYESVHF
jgi:hypothetical protein